VSDWRFILGRIVKNPLALAGIIIIFTFIVIAAFAPLIAPAPEGHTEPYDIPRDGYSPIPQAPSEEHIFGTTQGQYDIFYGVICGTRTAFRVALLVIVVVVSIGIVLGSLAGYFGGVIDEVIMRITDIFLAFPALILAMAIVAALGPSIKTVIIALIVVSWPSYARLIRGDILQVREEELALLMPGL
jgi:peptide/nickel transport system permease protein